MARQFVLRVVELETTEVSSRDIPLTLEQAQALIAQGVPASPPPVDDEIPTGAYHGLSYGDLEGLQARFPHLDMSENLAEWPEKWGGDWPAFVLNQEKRAQ